MRHASGESSTGTQDTPVAHLWFTTGLRHNEADSGKLLSGETVMAARPFNDNGTSANGNLETKARKANTPRARKARTRAKESTRVNTRAVQSLKAIVVTVESGDTSKKTVDIRTLLPKWMRRNLSNLQTAARAAVRTESHHHLLVCLSSAGTGQSTTKSISTLMEDHAQSGWLCEQVVGSGDARMRECEYVLLLDTGATEHVCGPDDFTHAALKNGPRPALKTAVGELLKHYGTRTVDFLCQGEELRVGFTVVDVKRPILSVSRLMDRGIETFIQAGEQFLRRFDGATVELTRRGGLFVLQCHLWMRSQRGKLLISHLLTRRWSVN